MLGDDWIELDHSRARKRLANILGIDLAYGAEVMEPRRAEELAEQFTRLYDDGVKFFTNFTDWETSPSGGRSRTGNPLTSATFDQCVLGIDSTRIGIVVVMDED
jgi:hypothetical protein